MCVPACPNFAPYKKELPAMKTSLFLCLALSPLTLLANGLKAPGSPEPDKMLLTAKERWSDLDKAEAPSSAAMSSR